jgi:ribosome-associated toxin RatA of RatAB toxin-antitoxin module
MAMEVHKSTLIAYSAESMFDLIEAVEHYPAFLPWCAGATVLARDESVVVANVRVDYHGLRLDFTTRNPKRRPEAMAITLEQGPFRRFEGNWRLTPLAVTACKIEFALSYEFDSAIARTLAGPVFARIADTMIDAFVARADSVLNTQLPSASQLGASPTNGVGSDDRQD